MIPSSPRPPAVVWLLVVLLLCLAVPADGQSLTRGTLSGVARDSVDARLPGVRVSVRETGSGLSRVATTDSDGRFEVTFLPAGEYEVRGERIGYRPVHVRGVTLSAGAVVRVSLPLAAVTPPVGSTDTLFYRAGTLSRAQPGVYRTYGPLELRRIPEVRRELTELARMSSTSTDGFTLEGLPHSLGGLLIDGVLIRPFAGLAGPARTFGAAAFPLSTFAGAQLIGGYPDAEWGGVAGGGLNAFTRRGSDDFRVGAFGSWSQGAFSTSASGDPLPGSLRGLNGGALVSGPILGDTATFVAGVEFWSLDQPLFRPFGADSVGREISSLAQDSFGVPLGDAGAAPTVASDVISLFSRFDWQLAPDHALTVAVNGALLGSPAAATGNLAAAEIAAAPAGRHVFATASLVSILGERLGQELRLSLQSSAQDAGSIPAELPTSTWFAAHGLRLGPDGDYSGNASRTVLEGSGAWYVDLAAHRVKVGLAGGVAAHERDPLGAPRGHFRFAGPEEFARAEGVYEQSVGSLPRISYTIPRLGLFVQDRWHAAEGLDITLGLRYDLESLPVEDVRPNQEWFERTGLQNDAAPTTVGALSPRFGFVWDVGNRQRWVVQGLAGVFAGLSDPEHLFALLGDDGRLEVRRAVGELGPWPTAPDDAVAPVTGPTLTLLAPGYRGPVTARGSLGVSRFLDARTALHLNAVYRRTKFLPRRVDLNLGAAPVATDRFGAPVFGRLIQQGAMLTTDPGSNRRFSDFDVVTGINADGVSEYQGVTVTLERRASERLNVFGSYTYSRTEDDWLSRARGESLDPLPWSGPTGAGEWMEGTSDFDVPHRVAVGGELRLPFGQGLRLAGLYRYGSGVPFTPGFAPGVDANADGSAGNEPAFITGAVPGMEPLLQQWECLRAGLDGFAQRNSCRTDGVQNLDLRIALQIARFGGSAAEIFLDALNLTNSTEVFPDRALYRVDASGELEVAEDGVVTVPLLANENFGKPLLRHVAGRQFRIGLRIEH